MTGRLREVLKDLKSWKKHVSGLDESMKRFDWATVIDDYDDSLERAFENSP